MNDFLSQTQDSFLFERNGRVYAGGRAQVIEPGDTREMAFAFDTKNLNSNYLWISGRYVQGEQANRNGQFWSTDDLKSGEASLKFGPLNVLHKWEQAVGVFVETKLVHREAEVTATAGEKAPTKLLPEIQALSLVWGHNFPQVAQAARDAHAVKKLWYSMECIGTAKQCLTCNNTYEWSAAEMCAHLSTSRTSPRRFIDPVFLGGALIFPPAAPGWQDADIEEVARAALEYADREEGLGVDVSKLTPDEARALLHLVSQVR